MFNVLLALLLMEIGFLQAMAGVLILYANLAAGWIGALSASLVISKPLGLTPPGIEFKRAYLYDINPVGVGAMALSILVSTLSLIGLFGPLAQAFSPAIGLVVAFVAAPLIALRTRGRYFLARDPDQLPAGAASHICSICENGFERPDMAWCPAYRGPICSLCCTLETRCHDLCKQDSRVTEQVTALLETMLPPRLARSLRTTIGQFVAVMAVFAAVCGVVLYFVWFEYRQVAPAAGPVIARTLWIVFFAFAILSGIAAWLIVLAHASRRAAERESAHHIDMLSNEVTAHDRTGAELQRAKEAAEAANAAKSRYIVGVSHEIRSPLNSIYGYAQLLERDGSVPPQEAGRVIRRSSEHLTNLVDGLLDISRIESGVLRLSRDTIRLPALLDQLTDMFRLQAAAKGIEFRHERPGWLPEFVRTDQKRLRQILINLLSNAVNYTREGHAGLTVRYRTQIAEFEVYDSGIGIKPEDIETIFEPFERGTTMAAHAQHGTGLGLSITKVLVQIMGGEIRVESVPGQGSRFLVRLMLPEPQRAPAEDVQPRRVVGYEGRRRTILLVDDDPAQSLVLRKLFEPLGFFVHSALEGASGIALAAECRPDLAILDLAMPGLSGWEVAAALRAARPADLRILMISANAHEYAPGGDGRAAHDMFLMKPVDFDALLDSLAELLELQWIGVDPPDDASVPAAAGGAAPSEAASFLGELERLGRIGHVRGIEAVIDEMVDVAPGAGGFAARLRARVKAFDIKGFLAIVRSARQDG